MDYYSYAILLMGISAPLLLMAMVAIWFTVAIVQYLKEVRVAKIAKSAEAVGMSKNGIVALSLPVGQG